jgi:hypothetical protein
MVAAVVYKETVLITLWWTIVCRSLTSQYVRAWHNALEGTGETVWTFRQRKILPHYLEELHSAF